MTEQTSPIHRGNKTPLAPRRNLPETPFFFSKTHLRIRIGSRSASSCGVRDVGAGREVLADLRGVRTYRCAGCCAWTAAGLSRGSSSGPMQTGICTPLCHSERLPPRCWSRSGTPAETGARQCDIMRKTTRRFRKMRRLWRIWPDVVPQSYAQQEQRKCASSRENGQRSRIQQIARAPLGSQNQILR